MDATREELVEALKQAYRELQDCFMDDDPDRWDSETGSKIGIRIKEILSRLAD